MTHLPRLLAFHTSISITLAGCALSPAGTAPTPPGLTMAEVTEQSQPADWRPLEPANTLYLELDSGRVVIELAPAFAPRHVGNIRTLAQQRYWDGLAVVRVQDNYVVQWADPHAGVDGQARSLGTAQKALPAEFDRDARGLQFTALPDGDVYAAGVGWSQGFAVGHDRGRTWLAHCYGVVGAGRDNAADSSNGSELYVVIGHAPRHLDRNITLVGRVVRGMEHLSALPRGSGAMGFHDAPEQHVPIRSLRLALDLPPHERLDLEIMRTDTPRFAQLVDSRRHRREPWFIDQVGKVELCNVPVPVRERAAGTGND